MARNDRPLIRIRRTLRLGATTTEPPMPLEPIVRPQALPAVLLDGGVLAAMLGVPSMVPSGTGAGPYVDVTMDPTSCGGVTQPGLAQAYDGSGYIAMAVRSFKDDPGNQFRNHVFQVVASYANAQAARALIDADARRWQSCASRLVTATIDGYPPDRITIGQPRAVDGTVAVSTVCEGADGWGCQRVLTSRHNVVIDTSACAFGGGPAATQISDRIAARVVPA